MTTPNDPKDPPGGFRLPGPLLALIFFSAGVMFVIGWLGGVMEDALPHAFSEERRAGALQASVWLMLAGIVAWLLSASPRDRRPPRPAGAKRRFPICAHCMKPFVEGAHFCPTCARPQTFFASTAWYEAVQSRAWLLGKAANHPTRAIHVWALTLVASGAVLGLVATVFTLMSSHASGLTSHARGFTSPDVLVGLLVMTLHAYIWIALATRSWTRWRMRLTDPGKLPPESEYGAPPWWSYDAGWAAPRPRRSEGLGAGGEASGGDGAGGLSP